MRQWLPELAAPTVVRTPAGPIDDVVPAARPITVADLLTFRAGYGFPSDFTRVSGRGLPAFLAERLSEPVGMVDTGFEVPAAKRDRSTTCYQPDPAGGFELVDAPDGPWSSLPAFPSGAGGLVSTVDDWHCLARMLGAETVAGRRPLSPASVRQMTTDVLTRSQREASAPLVEGQGRVSADRSTSRPSTPGKCRDATAGSAARARRRTSPRPPVRSPSCSARW